MSSSLNSNPISILLKSSIEEDVPFLRLSFQNDIMLIELDIEGMGITKWDATIDTHSVFELERLSEGLRYVVDGRLPDIIDVPSKEVWIGPYVGLTPALWFQLGLVIGRSGRGVMMYVSRINKLRRVTVIEIEVTCNGLSAVARFDTDSILAFADELYAAASSIMQQRFSDDL